MTGLEAPGRRRGRPYRLPEDPTPIQAAVPGLTNRIAWLLGVSRIHAADPRLTRREAFIDELRTLGIVADSSRLSRWESGRAPVPSQVLGAYERILGLPRGQLVAATAGMVRPAEAASTQPEPLDADPGLAHQQLDEHFEVVLAGSAPGHVWMELCELLTRQRHLYLLPATWSQVSELLASELARATGLAYLSRFEALRMLLRNPGSRRHALLAIGGLVTHPVTEFVVHPLSLLQEVDDPQARDLLLRLLSDLPGHQRSAAAWALSGQLRRNHYAEADLDRLEVATIDMLHRSRGPLHRLDPLAIHACLPEPSHARVLGSGLDKECRRAVELCRRHAELIKPEHARVVSHKLADRVETRIGIGASLEPDPMLRRLTREALFHVSHERRHQAANLLAVSPYRAALADELFAVAANSEETTTVLTTTALFHLADERQRAGLLQLALDDTRPTVRLAALLTLGQVAAGLSDQETDKLEATLGQDTRLDRAVLQVLGMAQASCLERLGSDPRFGEAARWWMDAPPIVEPPA